MATSPSVLAFRWGSDWFTQSSIPDLSVLPRIRRCPRSSTQPLRSPFQNHNLLNPPPSSDWSSAPYMFSHEDFYLLYPLSFVGTTREMWALLQLDFLKCARTHSKAATFPKKRKIKEACRLSAGWASSLHSFTLVFPPSALPLSIPFSSVPAHTLSGWNLSSWYQWPSFSHPSPAGCSGCLAALTPLHTSTLLFL